MGREPVGSSSGRENAENLAPARVKGRESYSKLGTNIQIEKPRVGGGRVAKTDVGSSTVSLQNPQAGPGSRFEFPANSSIS